MIPWLVITLYGLLLLIAVSYVVVIYNKKKLINSYICFQVAFILYYIFIPLIANIINEFFPYKIDGFLVRISEVDSYQLMYAFFYTLISYFMIIFVYNIRLNPEVKESRLRRDQYDIREIDNLNTRKYKIAVIAGLTTLLIGIMAELMIANSLGGVFKAVTMGDVLRSYGGNNANYIPQNKLFAIVLMVISLASTYFFVYALRIYKTFAVKMLLLFSVLASTFYLLINAGRIAVLLFLLTFFIDYAFRKTKHPFIFISIFSLIVFILLGALNDLFFYLSYGFVKESSTSIFSVVNEFSFPYLNLLNVQEINEMFGLRLGIDFITWIINIVPSAILNLFGLSKVTAGYAYITEYYSGKNASGGIPTDLLTLGIRQFGLIGVVIISTIVSICCKYIDRIIDKIHSKNITFITLRISTIMFIIVPYADLDSFIRNRYDMLLVFAFAIIISNLHIKNKRG